MKRLFAFPLILSLLSACGGGPEELPPAPKQSDLFARDLAAKEQQYADLDLQLSESQSNLEALEGQEETTEQRAEIRRLTRERDRLEVQRDGVGAQISILKVRLRRAQKREAQEEAELARKKAEEEEELARKEAEEEAPAEEPVEEVPEPVEEEEPVVEEPAEEEMPPAEEEPEEVPAEEEEMPGVEEPAEEVPPAEEEAPVEEQVPAEEEEEEGPPPDETAAGEKGIDRYNLELTFDERWSDIIKRVKEALEQYKASETPASEEPSEE